MRIGYWTKVHHRHTRVVRSADGKVSLIKETKIEFIDDEDEKPVGINRFMGRRPSLALVDLQMLQWTTAAAGARLGGLVHHTDSDREYAYDCQSFFGGKLDKALDEAHAQK
jgi:hypothetical protein